METDDLGDETSVSKRLLCASNETTLVYISQIWTRSQDWQQDAVVRHLRVILDAFTFWPATSLPLRFTNNGLVSAKFCERCLYVFCTHNIKMLLCLVGMHSWPNRVAAKLRNGFVRKHKRIWPKIVEHINKLLLRVRVNVDPADLCSVHGSWMDKLEKCPAAQRGVNFLLNGRSLQLRPTPNALQFILINQLPFDNCIE